MKSVGPLKIKIYRSSGHNLSQSCDRTCILGEGGVVSLEKGTNCGLTWPTVVPPAPRCQSFNHLFRVTHNFGKKKKKLKSLK